MALSVLLLSSMLIGGCGKEPSKPKPESPSVNSDPPNANSRILSQQVFGDADKKSYVAWLSSADGVSEWFTGKLNCAGTALCQEVGRLSATGTLVSHSSINYLARDIEALSSSSHAPGGAIVVGKLDNDGDDGSDIGYVTFFSAAGTSANQLLISSDSSDVWLEAIAPLSDSVFVAVGGERTPNRTSPLVTLIALTAAGTLEKRQQAVLSTLSGLVAVDVATDPGDVLASTRRIYLSVERDDFSSSNTAVIYGVDISPSTLAPWSVAWNRALPGKGVGTFERDTRVYSGALYVVGVLNDPDKGTPADGGYWHSGLVARLSLAGDIAWSKAVSVTGHSDELFRVEPTGSAIIAIGEAASYVKLSTGDLFGYGWVVRLAPADGNTLSSSTFGDANYESSFIGQYLAGSTLHAAGWTQEETRGGPYRSWWTAINLSATGAASVSPSVEARPGRALSGEAAPRWGARMRGLR